MKQSIKLNSKLKLKSFQIQSLKFLETTTSDLENIIKKEVLSNYCISVKEPVSNYESLNTHPQATKSLYEYLREQVTSTKASNKQQQTTLKLLNYLDKGGLFSLSKDSLQQQMKLSSKELDKSLKILQSCTPIGVASFSTTECLIAQLKYSSSKYSKIAQKILQKYKNITQLSKTKITKELKISEQTFSACINLIKKLNFTPNYEDETKNNYISPEIIITKHNEEYLITHTRNIPELSLNPRYLEVLADKNTSQQDKKEIKENIKRAKELINNINKRFDTLKHICSSIIEHQQNYFNNNYNEKKLNSLTHRQIAEKLNLNPSTISRAIKNIYIQLPNKKIFPLKYFFSTKVNKSSLSKKAFKEIIKEIIDKENKAQPLSDQTIINILKKQGIELSRRTLSKYRSELSIPNSRYRKSD